MGFSVGMGLTNACNLNCAHCYRSSDVISQLTLDDVQTVCESISVSSIGLGTGENALHPQFEKIVEYIHSRGIKLTMASNGYSLNIMDDRVLRMFHDVEVSLDFPTESQQDKLRGRGNWGDVHRAVERCQGRSIPVTVLATMMNINYDKLGDLADHARSLHANLRVNVYQAVRTDTFRLSYDEFWDGFRQLFSSARLVSCSEPVVCAAIGEGVAVSPCGHCSVRITPDGSLAPCVYWSGDLPRISDLPRLRHRVMESPEFRRSRLAPTSTGVCRCGGGCASRRRLAGSLDAHDEYCPWVRGEEMRLKVEMSPAVDLPRSSHVCTTIVA